MITEDKDVIIPFKSTDHNNATVGKPVENAVKTRDNGGGGEPPMEKYVTHEELQHEVDKLEAKIDLSTEKMMHHMDVENANMKSELKSVTTTLAFITGILIPIITAILLKFFHLN